MEDETLGPDPYSTVFVGKHPDVVPGEVIGFMKLDVPEEDEDTWLIGWPMNVACNYELDMAGDRIVRCSRCGRLVNWLHDAGCRCGWDVPDSWKQLIENEAITFDYGVWLDREVQERKPDTFTAGYDISAGVSDIVETLLAPWDEEHVDASYWMALRQLVRLCAQAPSHAPRLARDYELEILSEGRMPMDYWDQVAEVVTDYVRLEQIVREVIR